MSIDLEPDHASQAGHFMVGENQVKVRDWRSAFFKRLTASEVIR